MSHFELISYFVTTNAIGFECYCDILFNERTVPLIGEDKTHRYNLHCEKNEMVLGRAY